MGTSRVNVCILWFLVSATITLPHASTATSYGVSKHPGSPPIVPKAPTYSPSLDTTWTRWLWLSAITMFSWRSSARPLGCTNLPIPIPCAPIVLLCTRPSLLKTFRQCLSNSDTMTSPAMVATIPMGRWRSSELPMKQRKLPSKLNFWMRWLALSAT